ncbi:MAG: GerMN domain-containing protein [Lachnospiraceae bacterium]|nr:GerMN domain-containing protein [Lachnospiraceae bacterium]
MSLLLICILVLTGCSMKNASKDASGIYFLRSSGKELASAEFHIEEEDVEKWARKTADALNNGEGVPADGMNLFSGGVRINDLSFAGTILTVDLNPAYESQDTARKLLIRAGITKTMTQNPGITAVAVNVDGKPIYDSTGNEIGAMTAGMYVDDSADDISNYRSTSMTLYFTNERGDTLIPEYRDVYYSVNTPVEQAVVNELLQGPSSIVLFRTIPAETNVLNVTIQDDICYVNFDEGFLNNTLKNDPEVQIYSIVNSLSKVCQVEKVAFSVNGSSQVTLKDKISLDTVFSPNMELVEE